MVQLDHAYSKPWNWKSGSLHNFFAKKTVLNRLTLSCFRRLNIFKTCKNAFYSEIFKVQSPGSKHYCVVSCIYISITNLTNPSYSWFLHTCGDHVCFNFWFFYWNYYSRKEIVDIESISPPQSPPYDVQKASKVMDECENFSGKSFG